MALALWLAALGAVGVHLEELEDVPIETALAIAQALASSAAARLGEAPRVDDPTWASCSSEVVSRARSSRGPGAPGTPGAVRGSSPDRCLRETRARLEAESIVLVDVYGGPINMRVIAELVPAGSSSVAKSVELDVPRDPASWPRLFDGAAAALFPSSVARAPAQALEAPLEPGEPARVLPWALAGVSAVALGVGIGFGASARSAESRLESEVLPGGELDALNSRMSSHQMIANILIVTAIVAAGGSAALFVFD